MQESAFVNPPWLLERDGAGYIQVTELLYRIAEHASGDNTVEEIAAKITEAGKPVSPNTVRALIAQLLIPRGLVEMADGSVVPVATGPASPLALNMRMKMFGPESIMPVTNILRFLYWPPVMIAILAVAAVVEVWIYAIHGIGAGLHDAMYTPGLMLVLLVVVVVSAGFHQLGHAAALHYAGRRIKGMGAGIYVVYPAFFTDVSDNYRLPRWQRVRTDLGGFYFNLIIALCVMGLYVATGQEFLLLIVLLVNLEIIHQLLPFLRLDGYWTLADITGVPDFFTQMSAFARSVLPVKGWKGRTLPPMKWWAKVVFALYSLITIPLLIFLLVLMVRSVPRVLATAWDSFGQQVQALGAAQASGNILGVIGAPLQALLLLIPTIGLCYTLFTLGRRGTLFLWNWGKPNLARRAVSAVCFVGAIGLLGFMWIPQVPMPGGTTLPSPISPVSWQPIGADERGTVQDVVSDVTAGNGSAPSPPRPRRTTQPTTSVPSGLPQGDAQSRGTPQATAGTPVAGVVPIATPTPAVVTGSRSTSTPTSVARSSLRTPTVVSRAAPTPLSP